MKSPLITVLSLATSLSILGCYKQNKTGSQEAKTEPLSYTDFVAMENANALMAMTPDATDGPTCDAACEKYRQEFRYVVYVGQQVYCYWSEKTIETGMDYAALAKRLEKSIVTGTSFTQYYKVLSEWAGAFHDGHVNAIPGSNGDLSKFEIYSAPFRLEVLAPATDHEKLIVSQIKDRDYKDLSVGDEVIAVNGLAIKEILDQVEKYQGGSTSRMRRYWASRKIVDALGADAAQTTLDLTIKTSENNTKSVKIYRNVSITEPPSKSAPSAESSGIENIPVVRVLSGGIGYLKITGFGGSKMPELLNQALDRLMKTSGLILDLRQNGGGDLSGNTLLARFATEKITRYRQSERLSDFIFNSRPDYYFLPRILGQDFAVWHDLQVEPSSNDKHYNKPVIALIGAHCFSACDTFSASLKDNKLARFVGEGTGGGTGTPVVIELPNSELGFRYSVIRGRTPLGYPIEGVGTQPDVLIEPTVEDRKNGVDKQLEMAMSMLGQQVPSVPQDLSFANSWTQSLEISPTQQWLLEQMKYRSIDQ